MSSKLQQYNLALLPWRESLSSLNLSDKQLEDLNNCLDIQGQHGNWDQDEYMRGMYNGMEVMDSIVDEREPNFKESPKASLKLSWEEPDFEVGDKVKILSTSVGDVTFGLLPAKGEIGKVVNVIKGKNLALLKKDSLTSEWDMPVPSEADAVYEVLLSDKGQCYFLAQDLQKRSSLKLSWEELTKEEENKINILHAIYCAESVLPIFEREYPNDNRPRLAIELAKICLKYPSEENKEKAHSAAIDASYAYAANAAANAAYAAAWAADAAYAADTNAANSAIKYAKKAAKEANIDIDFDALRIKAEEDIWEYININESSLKLAWEEDPPNNPNRTSIEDIKDFIGPTGIFVTDYNSLIELLNKYSINAYPTVLAAFRRYADNPEFKGYFVTYSPYTIDEKVYLEISMIKPSKTGEAYITDSPLRIY